MKRSHLIESRFRGVYAGLLLMWVAASLALILVIDSWLVPQVIQQRVQTVEGLVHSHHEALIYNDNRALRDELLAQDIIADDRSFDEYWINNNEGKIQNLMASCHFVTKSTCISGDNALVFNSPAQTNLASVSFAVHLRTNYFSRIKGVILWKVAGSFVLCLLLGFVAWAIRTQEKFLVHRIGLLLSTFSRVESLFQDNTGPVLSSNGVDEFAWMSQSMEQAGATLRARAKQIEDYRKTFAQRAHIEQLAVTIGHTSHDLLAPMLETKVFLKKLPDYIETMPRDRLLESIGSLEKRVDQGADSLRDALRATKESYLPTESLDLATIITNFKKSAESNPSFRDIQVNLYSSSWNPQARVLGLSSDIDSVLWNLFNNSLDAKHDAGIRMEILTQSDEAVLRFQDDGPGIPEPLRERVFEDFFTTRNNGTGFGLASVRRVIAKSKGTIHALPVTNGALFEIRLPLMKSADGGIDHA